MTKSKYIKYNFALAVCVVGILCGLTTVVFKFLIILVNNLLFFGAMSFNYDVQTRLFSKLPSLFIIASTIFGGWLVTYIMRKSRMPASHGIPDVVFSLHYGDAYIKPMAALIKAITSAITIGCGGSAGVEGPVVYICSVVGSMQNKYVKHFSKSQKRILMVCGAVAGISAAFNAPIAAVTFGIEILLFSIHTSSVVPLMVSSAIAMLVHNYFHGPEFFVKLPVHMLTTFEPAAFIHYIVLGAISGCVAAMFIVSLEKTEHVFKRYFQNDYLRHCIGMGMLGIVLAIIGRYADYYYINGDGYPYITYMCSGFMHSSLFVVLILCLKILGTSLTLGTGGSGGVFAPTLFIGACIGNIYYLSLYGGIFQENQEQLLGFIVCGMASMLSGSIAAPITSVIFLLEITRSHTFVMPLIISVSIALVVRKMIIPYDIYHTPESDHK